VTDKDRLLAAIDFIRSWGARKVQVRYSDDEKPDLWMVAAFFDGKNRHSIKGMEVEVDLTPVRAAMRLCERIADGRKCRYCNRPIGLEPDSLATMPLNQVICWYQYDPELKKIRRSCE
jgi:hypothetical protein